MSLPYRIEALLLASDEPLSIQRLRNLLPDENSADLREALAALESHYAERGIRIEQVAGGWQFRTATDYADTVSQLWETRPPKLSRSMLETLAIIAYRQPTTRAEIEALRGMKVSSSVLGGLMERGWVKVLGRKEVPGRPHLYGTGREFLIDFGLSSLKELPDSSQLMDEDEVIRQIEAERGLADDGADAAGEEGAQTAPQNNDNPSEHEQTPQT